MFNWKITSMESYADSGIVLSANWECSTSEQDITVKRTGQSVFNQPYDTPIPYENLTEAEVLEWVWTDGGVDQTLVQESLAQELQGLLDPIVVKNPLPWA